MDHAEGGTDCVCQWRTVLFKKRGLFLEEYERWASFLLSI
jgi:hypothetical protein